MMKRTLRSRRWAPSIAAVAAFGVLGATCAYWALQVFAPPIAIAPTGSLVDTRSAPDLVGAQALFGHASSEAATVAAPADLDIRVLGVAASPSRGSAVLVVDSGAAKAFLVGDEVGSHLRLVEVRSDAAVLERNGVRIELPAPQRPSVALLSSGPNTAGAPSGDEVASGEPPTPHAGASSASIGTQPTSIRPASPGSPAPHAPTFGTGAPPDVPDDPAIEAATLSPRGGGAAIDPSRFSGIRGSSVRALDHPAGAHAPAPGAER